MSYMRFNFRSQCLGHYVDVSIVYPTDNYSYFPQGADAPEGREANRPPRAMAGNHSRVYTPGMKFQTVYLIHGNGTGALRAAIQRHLRGHRNVKSFRLGRYGEGESGVTVVELK